MKRNSTSDIDRIIASLLTGKISNEDQDKLNIWLKQDEAHVTFFEETVKTWQFSGTFNKIIDDDTHNLWKKVESRIANSPNQSSNRIILPLIQNRFKPIKKALAVAAVLVFVFFAGNITGFIYKSGRGPMAESSMYEVVCPNGTRSELLLADGTKVWLNAGSTLKYAQDYNINSREVELTGEAFFHVKTNKRKPFLVKASGLKIKATGTSFNVKAYPDEATMTTLLVEGKLTVEGKTSNKKNFKYTLAPKQKMDFVKDEYNNLADQIDVNKSDKQVVPGTANRIANINSIQLLSNVKTDLYTSWKDSRWIFEKESLVNLAIMLERRYNVNIEFESEDLKNFNFTGIIENETLEQVMNILQLTAPIAFELGKGEVKITLDNTQQNRFHKLFRKD